MVDTLDNTVRQLINDVQQWSILADRMVDIIGDTIVDAVFNIEVDPGWQLMLFSSGEGCSLMIVFMIIHNDWECFDCKISAMLEDYLRSPRDSSHPRQAGQDWRV